MKAGELDAFLASLDPAVRRGKTVDGFKWGSPDAEVTGVAVSWMSTQAVIERAIAMGLYFVLTHEPTFYVHEDTEAYRSTPAGRAKVATLAAHDMVIYRMHDAWDGYPGYGIVDRLLAHLDMGRPRPEPRYPSVLDVAPLALEDLVERLKAKLGLEGVTVVGDPQRTIRVMAVGVGAGGFEPLLAAEAQGADCYVAGELSEWQHLRYAEDAGLAVIVVGHAASEAYGMIGMVDLLRERFPGLRVEYLSAGNGFAVR